MSRLPQRLFILRRLALHCLNPAAWRRKRPDTPRSILILHHLLLGDSLMLTPLLAKLADRYPQAQRYVACPRAFVGLYGEHPYGVEALPWDPRTADGLHTLREAAPFDLVIIPAENRYSLLARVLGARWTLAFADDTPVWKNWLVDEAHPLPASPSAFGDFCATLIEGDAPATFRHSDWTLPECRPFEAPAGPYVILHLGASTPLKHWPVERWQALAAWLYAQGLEPVWSAGAKETDLVRRVDPTGQFRSTAGQLDLLQLAHLFAQARLVICPDTGVTHLARIVGVPTVALFGPGSSQICGAGNFWRESPFIALSAEIECRNQTVTFRRHAKWIRRCARGYGSGEGQCPHPRCMDAITLDSVQDACASLLVQATESRH